MEGTKNKRLRKKAAVGGCQRCGKSISMKGERGREEMWVAQMF